MNNEVVAEANKGIVDNVKDSVTTYDALFTIDNNSSTVSKVEYQLKKDDKGIFNYEFTDYFFKYF